MPLCNNQNFGSTYDRLTPVLFGALGRLARTGFVAPPADLQDLIQDFYVEAWPGLLERYRPELASFEAYASGAFVQFARPRIVRLSRIKQQLADPVFLDTLASSANLPDDYAYLALLRNPLTNAINALDADSRKILVAYCYSGASERDLARSMKLSRYRLRERLIDALAQVVVTLPKPPSITQLDWEVARSLWKDKRTLSAAARILQITEHQARVSYRRCVRTMSQVLRNLEKPNRSNEMKLSSARSADPLQLFLDAITSSGKEELLEEVRQHAQDILHALTVSNDDKLDALDASTINAQWVARVYEALAAPEWALNNQGDETYLKTLFEATQEDLRSIGDAFENALLVDVPNELKTFEDCFSQVPAVDPSRFEALLCRPDVRDFGLARSIAVFGITPAMVLVVTNSISRLAERMIDRNLLKRNVPLLLSVGNADSLLLEKQQFDYFLVSNEVQRTLPSDPVTAESILRWSVGIAQYKPFIFDRFRTDPDTRFSVTLTFTGEERRNIFTRWGTVPPVLSGRAQQPADSKVTA